MPLTRQNYQDALLVQSACNLSGVVHSLADMMSDIRSECNGTGEVNEHPITQLFVAQLYLLAYGRFVNQHKYDAAFRYCEQKVAEMEDGQTTGT